MPNQKALISSITVDHFYLHKSVSTPQEIDLFSLAETAARCQALNANMLPSTAQNKRPNVSTPRTPYTVFLRQFIGDYLRMLYLHGHTHTLVEFASAMDEVFKQVYREFDIQCEVSYDQWVSRKDQWDKDFDIKHGGPSNEVRDGLLQYPTLLECNEGKIRPRARQSGHWLRSDPSSNAIKGNQPLPLGKQPSEMYLKEHSPVHHQVEDPWNSGGSLSNAHQTSIFHPSVYNEPFPRLQMDTSLPLPSSGPAGNTTTSSTRYFDTGENITISPSYLTPADTNHWNVVDSTLPYDLSLSTYSSLPVQPTSSLQDLGGGRSRANTSTQPDPSSNPVSTAQGRDNLYPQTRPSA